MSEPDSITLRLAPALVEVGHAVPVYSLPLAQAPTLGQAVVALGKAYPALEALLWHGGVRGERLNPQLVLFYNDEQVPAGTLLHSVLAAGDVLELITAIEGG